MSASPAALQAFHDEAHRALRDAQIVIQEAATEARKEVQRSADLALTVAYGKIQQAAEQLQESEASR